MNHTPLIRFALEKAQGMVDAEQAQRMRALIGLLDEGDVLVVEPEDLALMTEVRGLMRPRLDIPPTKPWTGKWPTGGDVK